MEENKEIKVENNNQVNTPNENNVNNNQELMPVKKNNVIIIFLVIIILLMAAGLVYVLFFTKDDKEGGEKSPSVTATPVPQENEETPTPTPQEAENSNESSGDNELVVYMTPWGTFTETQSSEYEKIVVKTKNPDAKYIVGDDMEVSTYFLYDDGGLKIYNSKTKKIIDVNLSNKYKNYVIYLNDSKDKVIGISFVDSNSMSGYYNLITKKEMYKNKYKFDDDKGYIYPINDERLTVHSNGVSYLLDINTEKVIASYNVDADGPTYVYGSFGENGSYIYALRSCYDDCIYEKLYSNTMKEIKIAAEDFSEKDFTVYNNFLYLIDDDYVKKYSINGEELSKSEKYDKALQVIRNYVVYYDGDNLKLENVDNKSESVLIANDVKGVNYDSLLSRYYTRDELDNMDEYNKKEGLYVVFYYGYNNDGSSIKDTKGNYGMEYCYTTDKKIIEYPIKQEMGGRAKPVLYLYPEKETDVTVKFEKPDLLTTTYPKYINSWNVTAKPNGDLLDKDGKYYYALYWDEKRYNEVDFKEGFYVESKDAIKFLEEKLSIIGLSDKERNEFIMYWLPIMENNGKNLVYFELTKERELGNKLIIEPKPDSLLRVSIHIKKVNEKTNIKEQKLETFKRSGFTAVEWGGMTY